MNVFSDFRHVNKREVDGFRLDLAASLSSSNGEWHHLSTRLSRALQDTSEFRQMRFTHDTFSASFPSSQSPSLTRSTGCWRSTTGSQTRSWTSSSTTTSSTG
jgi:hypothetical protein